MDTKYSFMDTTQCTLFIIFIVVICFILYILPKTYKTSDKGHTIDRRLPLSGVDDEKKRMDETIKIEDYQTIIKQNNILCIGSRGSYKSVKCIIMDNKLIYCSTLINWDFIDDDNVTVSNVKIPITNTRNTTFQCWPFLSSSEFGMNIMTVSEKEFNEYLQELQKRISEGIL